LYLDALKQILNISVIIIGCFILMTFLILEIEDKLLKDSFIGGKNVYHRRLVKGFVSNKNKTQIKKGICPYDIGEKIMCPRFISFAEISVTILTLSCRRLSSSVE